MDPYVVCLCQALYVLWEYVFLRLSTLQYLGLVAKSIAKNLM